MNFSHNDNEMSAIQAQFEAQKIAFAPIIFQAVRVLKKWNVLKILNENNDGLTIQKISQITKKTEYAIQVLLETALSANIVSCNEDKYFLSKIGYFLQNDDMTKVNLNFNHHVNYLGMFELDKSLEQSKPVGLKYFGDWNSIYPFLSTLPKEAKDSWFEFDHFYSDNAFKEAINTLKILNPKNILDIGGNTGKFSLQCASILNNTSICIADLPEQIALSKKNIKKENMQERISTYAIDILSKKDLPKNFDIIWMSQFLDCFSKEEILFILKKVVKAMGENSRACILEPIWDRQRFETSSFCIINTSPYFTALANGKSKMFKSSDLEELIVSSGLDIETIIDNLGFGHSLFICKLKSKDNNENNILQFKKLDNKKFKS